MCPQFLYFVLPWSVKQLADVLEYIAEPILIQESISSMTTETVNSSRLPRVTVERIACGDNISMDQTDLPLVLDASAHLSCQPWEVISGRMYHKASVIRTAL